MTRDPDPARPDRGTPQVDARRMDGVRRDAPSEWFTYRVLSEPERTSTGGERRNGSRQRTRLRSGKIVDRHGRFLVECLIADRSPSGGRLRLPGPVALPARIQLYDDQFDCLLQAAIVWRKDREIGVRFLAAANTPRHRVIAESMRRKFYSVPT